MLRLNAIHIRTPFTTLLELGSSSSAGNISTNLFIMQLFSPSHGHKRKMTSRHLIVHTSNRVKLELFSAQIFLAHIYRINCICLLHTHQNTNCHVQHTTHTLQYTIYSHIAASTACRVTQKEEQQIILINNFKGCEVRRGNGRGRRVK